MPVVILACQAAGSSNRGISMTDHVAAYRGIRDRVTQLTAPLADEAADRLAPATPEWRIRDLLAHLTGVEIDVLAGNLEGAGTDPWTEAQVAPRRHRSVEEVLTEWHESAAAFDELIPAIPDSPRSQLIFDAMTHEFDIRGALDIPGARDEESTAIGFGWAADIVGMMRDGADAGALCLRTEFGDTVVGAGEVTATVAADRFELFRAMTGRRCPEQIAAFRWDGHVAVEHLAFLGGRTTPLVE